MKYTDKDFENIIALCELDESENEVAKSLRERCKKALAYKDVSIRITERNKKFLSTFHNPDIDSDVLSTLNKVMGVNWQVMKI